MDNNLLINKILKQVKSNKKYSSLADSVVKKEIQAYLKSNPRATEDRQTIKEIRAKLHRLYSSYQTKKKNKANIYLQQLKTTINKQGTNSQVIDITNKLLSTTLSTKERLKDYQFVYNKIFFRTGKPKTIVDLGAGANPLSFPLMNLKKLTYYAYDIDEEDVKFLNKYFEIMKKKGLNGKAEILDVRDLEKIEKNPKSEVVFMFKLIDLIDENNKKISEELIKKLIKKTKFIVVSFATRTLTRKKMNLPRRKGFELMLERIGLKFGIFSIENEVFYVISKFHFNFHHQNIEEKGM